MKNNFIYSDDNKRYHTWNYHLRKKFGAKIAKISLNGGFTCPNKDGTKGTGGCTYCSSKGSGDFAGDVNLDIKAQFEQVREVMDKKWDTGGYIAYFQANTNTYAPLEVLRQKFEAALAIDGVVGLSIATRADCIEDDVADYLEELSKRTYLIVELGLQTIHESTAEYINRGHSYEEFSEGYQKLKSRGINICVHIINGLPFETHEMMLQTAAEISRLKPHCVKIHLLHIMKNTVMADQYLNGEFKLPELEEYVQTVCDQLELIDKEIIIQRITGDAPKDLLIAPLWSLKKFVVMNEIDKEMERRNSTQGCKVKAQAKM